MGKKERQAAWARKEYAKDPEAAIARVRERMERVKEKIYAIKSKPCADCGGKFPPVCMDFDHRPAEELLFGISLKLTLSWKRLEAEIAKCDIVCANCHRIRTANRMLRRPQ